MLNYALGNVDIVRYDFCRNGELREEKSEVRVEAVVRIYNECMKLLFLVRGMGM